MPTTLSAAVTDLLAGFGVEIAPGGIVLADIAKAERAYVHHAHEPVAVAAFAAVSPSFAKGRFPKYRLADLVAKRPDMDEKDATALAAVCGVSVTGPFWSVAAPFAEQLAHVLARYDLTAFYRAQLIEGAEHHYAIRPTGYDFRTNEIIPAEMDAWRAGYRGLPLERQMMVATIMWLYRGGADSTWLKGLPCGWHAADAVHELRAAGAVEDWARLVALYPGW